MKEMSRETKKHTDFDADEIKIYLNELRKAILAVRYLISQNDNRQENTKFIEDYKVDSIKEKEILLSLQYDDFCYAVDNDNPEFPEEKLYIFCKESLLDKWGKLEDVEIYIKINMTQTRRGDDFVFIVSFHKRKLPIKYLFRAGK